MKWSVDITASPDEHITFDDVEDIEELDDMFAFSIKHNLSFYAEPMTEEDGQCE